MKIDSKKKFWTVLFVVALSLAFMEIGLRVTAVFLKTDQHAYWNTSGLFPEFDDLKGPGLYYAHPYGAYRMKPGIPGRSNNLGFRGKDITPQKAEGVFRIVILGGSTVYGARNTDEFTLPVLLEKELSRAGKQKIEVINAGLISGTTMESLYSLNFRILPLEPDLVIIYDNFNDLVPRIADHFQYDYSHFRKIPLRPFYGLNGFLNKSYIARFVKFAFSRGETLQDYTFNKENIPKENKEKIDNFRKNGPATFRAHMELMIKILQACNIRVMVPTFAFCEGLYDGWIREFPDELFGPGIIQNNEQIQELTRQYHLPTIDFYTFCLGKNELFSGKIHMSNQGNMAAAKFFSAKIIEAYPELLK